MKMFKDILGEEMAGTKVLSRIKAQDEQFFYLWHKWCRRLYCDRNCYSSFYSSEPVFYKC